jgi:phenylacetate-CoA ligase
MNPDYEYKFRDPCIVLRSFSPEPEEPLFKVDNILNYWYLSPFDISDKTIKFYYDVITKSNAKLLRAYPSSLYILTLYLEKYGLRIPSIRTLFTSSENLLPLYRSKIESYWKIPLIDWYGQNERTATVQMCEYGIYHNNDEYGVIELDKRNQIIATSLNNNIMPLIRYATNDIAVPSTNDKCKCGRGLSIPFSAIDGRADDLLVKDDGSIIPTVNIYNAMELFQDIKQFRIIQDVDRSIKLEIVVADFFTDNLLIYIKHEISKRVGNLKIDIRIIDHIDRDRITGKVKAIISKAKNSI